MTPIKIYISLVLLFAGFNLSTAQGKYDNYFNGLAAFNNTNYQDAVQHFSVALEKPGSPQIKTLEMRGKSYLALNQFANAERDFNDLSEIDLAMGSYCLAQCYAQQGDAAKTVAQLQIHLQQYFKNLKSDILLDPAFSPINTSKEWLALWSGDHYSKTEEQYADAVYHFRIGEYDFALDILDQMIVSKSRYHRAYSLRAEIYQKQREYSRSLTDLNEAINLKKKQADYYAMRANVYVSLEKNKEALEDIQQARKLDPIAIDYMLTEAEILTRLGEPQKALELATEYSGYFCSTTEALYIAGKCLYMQKRLAEASDKFSHCIETDPAQVKYWLARGNVNIALSQPEKAVADYSMALDLDPKQAKVYFSRAFAYQDLNEKDRACSDFKKAFSLGFKEALSHIQEYCGE